MKTLELMFNIQTERTSSPFRASSGDGIVERIAWRKARRSPEKCLICGSTRIIRERNTWIEGKTSGWYEPRIAHPDCGGEFAGSRMADHVPDVVEWVLPEGPIGPPRPWWRFW